MDCLKKNCNISGNERMISCWLCLGTYHLKCTPLKARDADAIGDPAKSIQWTCPNCKQINIDFYKFFKSYKNNFEQLSNDFLLIQNKFREFGELFTKFQSLDKSFSSQDVSSPKLKKRPTKSAIIPELTISSELNIVSAATPLTPADNNNKNKSSATSSSHLSINHDSMPTTPLDSIHHNEIDNNIPEPNNINYIASKPLASVNNMQTVHNLLRAIPPKKTIFLSRLVSDTTSEDINFYIKNKISTESDIIIHKFQFPQPRSIASFKISVSDDIFKHIIVANFWPKNTLVREFIFKDRPGSTNVGVIPQSEQNVSKN